MHGRMLSNDGKHHQSPTLYLLPPFGHRSIWVWSAVGDLSQLSISGLCSPPKSAVALHLASAQVPSARGRCRPPPLVEHDGRAQTLRSLRTTCRARGAG